MTIPQLAVGSWQKQQITINYALQGKLREANDAYRANDNQ